MKYAILFLMLLSYTTSAMQDSRLDKAEEYALSTATTRFLERSHYIRQGFVGCSRSLLELNTLRMLHRQYPVTSNQKSQVIQA